VTRHVAELANVARDAIERALARGSSSPQIADSRRIG
jgi:hypothetical protein